MKICLKRKGEEIMRSYYDVDKSSGCTYIQYVWTLPKVQEMYANSARNGKMKDKSEGVLEG